MESICPKIGGLTVTNVLTMIFKTLPVSHNKSIKLLTYLTFANDRVEALLATEARACTGVLAIHPMSRDIKIANLSVTFHGAELLVDTKLELSVGQR